MKNLELPDALKNRRLFGFFDDFEWLVTAHRWTTLVVDAGSSAAVGDAVGGKVVLTTGAVDNNEVAIRTTNEIFKFAADKPMLFETSLQYAEAATNAANVMVGFMDAMIADAMVDNGVGPKASFSGAVLYKVDGGTVWRFMTSIGTARIDTVSRHTAGGAADQVGRIEVREAGGIMEAVPFLDGVQMQDANLRPIKHTFAPTSATEMMAGIYAKAGGAASEIITADYAGAYQLR